MGYRCAVKLHPRMHDAKAMTRRPWLKRHEAARVGAQDAKRVSSFVFSKVLAGQTVTENEIAILLANSRDYMDTSRGTRRPTDDERERARLALRELSRHNPQLRKCILLEEADDE